jgi:hypothetical protein
MTTKKYFGRIRYWNRTYDTWKHVIQELSDDPRGIAKYTFIEKVIVAYCYMLGNHHYIKEHNAREKQWKYANRRNDIRHAFTQRWMNANLMNKKNSM